MTFVEKTLFETLIVKYVYSDTMIHVKEKNVLEREFTCEDWSHCLHRRSFKSVNWAIFVQSGDHNQIIPPRMMNYAKIPCKSTIHLFRGSSTRSLLYCRNWTRSKKKRTKEVVRGMYSLVQKEDKHFLYHGRRVYNLSSTMEGGTICLNDSASEAEVITDTKKSRKVNDQIH